MSARLGRPIALLLIVGVIARCAAPPPAQAFDPVKPICSLAGLVSTLAGKVCSVARHPGRLVGAGKQLLGGHAVGAVGSLLGDGGSTVARSATATAGLASIVAWVAGGAKFALHETAAVITATTQPNLQSTWFSASYWRMAGISALLTLPFLFAAAIQAVMASDLSLLLRAAFGYLPLALLAVSLATPVTTLLLSASDELSGIVSAASGDSGGTFLGHAAVVVGGLSAASRSPFLAFVVGLLTAAATLTLWIELLIRSAATYVIVLMLPLFFAALVWPARRVWALRAVELLVALILSKFAIVAVLALGGAALSHTVIPSATTMLAGATLVLLAAFSPWALLRMLPLHELASGAAGGLRAEVRQLTPAGNQGADTAERAVEIARELPAQMRREEARESQAAEIALARLSRDRQAGGRPTADHDGNVEIGAPRSADGADGAGSESPSPFPQSPSPFPQSPSPFPESPSPFPESNGSLSGSALPAAQPSAAPADEPARRPGMPALWQAPDGGWRTLTLGLENGWPPPPLIEADSDPASEAADRPPGQDHHPRPPRQEPDGGPL